MEWIKEKPPLEKEKSDKQISKQIDQNAKATTNLLEKVRKYRPITLTPMLMIRSHHFSPDNYFGNQGIRLFILDDDRQDSNTGRA